MKKVFISHPFSSDPEVNRERVEKICRQIVSNNDNILPISPLHLFGYLNKEKSYREDIMETCYKLIDISDEVWLYIYDMESSKGQHDERIYALDNDVKVIHKNGDNL